MPRINNSNIKNENTLISEIGEIIKNTITDTYFNVVNSYYVSVIVFFIISPISDT